MAFASPAPASAVAQRQRGSFTRSFVCDSEAFTMRTRMRTRTQAARMAVVEAKTETDMDNILKTSAAEGSLVVIDYSTTWCGPCKVIAPKFEEMSDKYSDCVFVKVMGDVGDGPALMRREGIRSVPAFHFWKDNKCIHAIVGAKVDDLEASIKEYK